MGYFCLIQIGGGGCYPHAIMAHLIKKKRKTLILTIYTKNSFKKNNLPRKSSCLFKPQMKKYIFKIKNIMISFMIDSTELLMQFQRIGHVNLSTSFKGSDHWSAMYASWTKNLVLLRICFRIHLRHIKRFSWCIITEFERKVDVQNHPLGWLRRRKDV